MTTPYRIAYGDTLGGIAASNGLTVQQILAANPNITNANNITAGSSLILPSQQNSSTSSAPATSSTPTAPSTPSTSSTSTSYPIYPGGSTSPMNPGDKPIAYRDQYGKDTPVTSSTGGTTIGAAAQSIVPDFSYIDNTDPAVSTYIDSLKLKASGTIDEADLRKQARERIQAQIDAIKLAGAQSLARAKEAGKGRLGTSTAIAARSGTLGSTFSEADTNNITTYNQGIESDIDAETQAKIVGLLNQADKDASQEIADRKAAKEKGAEAYVQFITNRNTARASKASALAKTFAAQGIDPTKLSAVDAQKLQDAYGIDPTTFAGMINDQKTALDKEKVAADKDRYKTLSDGTSLYDTTTGKVVAENTKNFAANKYTSGAILAGAGTNGASGITLRDGTKLRYDDPDFTLKMIRGSSGNKRVPTEGELNPIIKAQRALGQLGSIATNISSQDTGPIIGLLRSYNPYDANAQQVKAQLQALIPTLARGVYGEVGVLTDQDIINYAKTVPNLKSTADVNKLVLAMTIDGIKGSVESQLQNLAAGNRNVANFEPIYSGLKAKSEALRNELGSASSATPTSTGATVKMRGPNGQSGSVPASKVESAKAQGWIVIQ